MHKTGSIFWFSFLLLCIDSHGWEALVAHKPGEKNLKEPPSITTRARKDGIALVEITNTTGVTIRYWGYGKTRPQLFWKEKREGEWVANSWDRCGTGMNQYLLRKGQTATFELPLSGGNTRIFTIFYNAVDQKECSLVKLQEASEAGSSTK